MQLYLPDEWTRSRKRCKAAGVPSGVKFQKKWRIGLSQLDDALAWGVRRHLVLADAGYGDARESRDGVRERGLHYLMGVQGMHKVWPSGTMPRKPEREPGQNGRPRTRYVAEGVQPWPIEELALQLPKEEFQTVSWREGSRGEQSSWFAAVRVRTAERHVQRAEPSEEVWLLIEWPLEEKAPTKYSLSSLPANTPLTELVRLAELRWRVERDYQELIGEVGLDHFEGRGWRGFHYHVPLCMVAHGVLALRRALSPWRRTRWTLPEVRRRFQHLLLRRIGHCPLCLRHIGARAPPRGPSRM